PTSISQTGLLQYLDSRGYAVFAISFSHTQGNNLIQAQLIADAIEVILAKTGATQVDIVAHSKGNLATIAYLSSLNNEWNDTLWMTDYRGDVRKFVAVAAPFKGLDTMFRYYTANTTVIADNLNSPTAFYNAYIYYAYRDYHRWDMTDTYDNNFFAGQTQLLHNWIDDPDYSIDFNSESATWGDFNATRNALYWGGSSFYISSEGIDTAINNPQGSMGTSNFIKKMNNRGVNPYIDLFVLYGTNQVMNYTWFGYSIGEKADTSDGLLFVASATYTTGVTKRGADLILKSGMNYNHLDIARENEPLEWIENALAY
ncbi:MAG: lipase family protein, partial [Desulfobacterales bacterium]|nr:lipase family protein [Desulfobacterales bacterium]